ncbi:hypothetical protein [Nostoc sp. CMAA1605]|uniref:hypothetical protein n=1 Tax=Nostoc sp. CMAA1605 TaxID=2055159 RepID=UPI001F414052|nr:hypothetical protein [Nostoc sp. CMAA1605]MCF4967473.1 hypothetical protein [Nostoc sp. CMAA1605]
MKIIINVALFIICVICTALLIISIYPGVLDSLIFIVTLVSILSIPGFFIVGIMFLVVVGRRINLRDIQVPWRRIGAIATIILVSYILLKFYIPRRLAFMISRSAFEQTRVRIPFSVNRKTTLDRRLGLYTVDELAIDSRGGVYFRVYSGGSGFSPDTTSYGFVYQPNREGSPFGMANYQVFSLDENWYWFRVSDDW